MSKTHKQDRKSKKIKTDPGLTLRKILYVCIYIYTYIHIYVYVHIVTFGKDIEVPMLRTPAVLALKSIVGLPRHETSQYICFNQPPVHCISNMAANKAQNANLERNKTHVMQVHKTYSTISYNSHTQGNTSRGLFECKIMY